MNDITTLSYWFPKLQAAGLPVPETHIIQMPKEAREEVWGLLDGKPPAGLAFEGFVEDVANLCSKVSYPAFLRTGHTSGKHQWSKTCYVWCREVVRPHILRLVEFSEMVDMLGLPWNEWVVRKFLKAKKVYGCCPHYEDMPVTKEFRFFVRDSEVLCAHPYWPKDALVDGGLELTPEKYAELCNMGESKEALYHLASKAGEAVGGEWSVDIFEAVDGWWYITDMAEAKKSWHWPGCESEKDDIDEL